MTIYQVNQQINIDGFLNASQNQIKIVAPNGTANRIENPSFEMPTYDPSLGTLSQWNWSYTSANNYPKPVTFDHAFSGSYAWKARMNNFEDVISYGETRAIKPTVESGYQDILSFYYYAVVDAQTNSYTATNYGVIIGQQTAEFAVQIWGSKNIDGSSGVLLQTRTFTATSLPKNNPGDLDRGVSGSMVPHFYDWKRFSMILTADIRQYNYFFFKIVRTNVDLPIDYDYYLVIDAFLCEKQPYGKLASMYFDGSYEGFNSVQYPKSFQWTGSPHQSISIRSYETRSNGELVGIADFCNFFLKSVNGLEAPPEKTDLFTKTLYDGQYFVEQITQSRTLNLNGRIIADSEAEFIDSFARLQELFGKKPFAQSEPVRIYLELSFTNGLNLVPVYLDVVYNSGLELDTSNIFQSEIELNLAVISTSLMYQNDSSSNMFNDRPLFDQFNTMEIEKLRNVGGFFYYNKSEEKWESPSGIAFFKHADFSYTSDLPYGGSGVNQKYESRNQYTVGDVHVIKEDRDGVIWFGGRFELVEIEGYYTDASGNKNTVRFRIHVNNIVGLRKRNMSGDAYVYPKATNVTNVENSVDLTNVTFFTDWQVIPLLDAPTRYSQSNELNPPFVGLKGNSIVRAIEFTPDGTMYIGGNFFFEYGNRHFSNFLAFAPYSSDSQNVNLYIPEHLYSFVSVNFNSTALLTAIGRGRYRNEWVNSLIPYCKYGVFTEVGHVGSLTHDSLSAVYDIKYDYQNQALYLCGTFTTVSNTMSMYDTFSVARLVRYNPATKTFNNMGVSTVFGVDFASLTVSASRIIRKMAIQYTAAGVNIIAVGTFQTAGETSESQSTWGVAIFNVSEEAPSVASAVTTGGGGYRNGAPSASADFHDVVISRDQRIFISGNFDKLNRGVKPVTNVTGFAEYKNGLFIDVTRGLEANYYPDAYNEFPDVKSMSIDSQNNVYFVGDFTNVKNRLSVDGIAKWDGIDFSGCGIHFVPGLKKVLQSIFVDSADNVYVFTGPGLEKTTILKTMYNDISAFSRPTSVEVAWTNLEYTTLREVFGTDDLDIQFFCRTWTDSGVIQTAGKVYTAVRLNSTGSTSLSTYASKDIIFIGGRFDYIKIADLYFRVNNLVALEYDPNCNPFPYKVTVFSPGESPYYDEGTGGEDGPFFGINCDDRRGVTDGAVFSIDVKTQVVGSNTIPTYLFVGGRFDFTARGVRYKNFINIQLQRNDDNTWIKYNNPENYEARLSVPYMNYATYKSPGPCGAYGNNDAVYAVKASFGNFLSGASHTDPNIVFIGGDFKNIASGNVAVQANRFAIYTIGTGFHTSLNKANAYYNIALSQTLSGQGINPSTAWSKDTFVRTIQYANLRTVSGITYDTTALPMGSWTYTGDNVVSNATSVSTGSPIVRVGVIPNTGTNQPFNVGGLTTALTGSNQFITSADTDLGTNIWVVGSFVSGTQQNTVRLTGSTSSSVIANSIVAANDWTNIYKSSLGLNHVPTHVFRSKYASYPSLFITGANKTPATLFADATIVKYNTVNNYFAANYAYGNVNMPQVTTDLDDGTSFSTKGVERKYMQAATYDVGYPLAIQSNTARTTVSIPYQNYTNTLYDANIMQTFNCYNNGTVSVSPTISIASPFKGNVNITSYVHVITNVTTRQSINLGIWVQANEIIRIRTDKERISVISNIRGDMTNAILNTRNIRRLKTENAQLFRLVPGKNVIRYGPTMPMQRYFRSGSVLSKVVYNKNQNVVVPQAIITMSWTIAFNSIHDAIYTHTNPLLLR